MPHKFKPTTPNRSRIENQIIEASWCYYHDNLNQAQIAERLGVSRGTIVNYLNEAQARGYVRISLQSEVFRERQIADELRDKFGLKEALIAPSVPDNSAETLNRVARATADWLPTLLAPNDRLGVSWGETVYLVSNLAEQIPIPGLEIVQLVGSRATPMGFAAETCSANLAQKFAAKCINLHAPLVVDNAELATMLRQDSAIAAQLESVRNCNKTIFAAGTCDPDSHIAQIGIASQDLIAEYRAKGAMAVVCGRFLDADGNTISGEIDRRMIGVEIEDMHGKDMGLLTSAGLGRVDPIKATIKAGFTTHLVTCFETANELMKSD